MADFRDKRVRRLFEAGGLLRSASIEDNALAQALLRQLRVKAIRSAETMAEEDLVELDPLPVAASSTPQQDGKPEG